MNYGINLKKEEKEQSTKDWVLGGEKDYELDNTIIELNNSTIYDDLPIGELQRGKNDYMDCVSRAAINVAETIFNNALKHNKIHPANVKWLTDTGYILEYNGIKKVEFSDEFIAIKSGTTSRGNSVKAPVEAVRKYGLIPKSMLHGNPNMWRKTYLSKYRITKKMEDIGLEFKRRFPIIYYRIYKHEFEKSLHKSPILVAGYAWSKPVNGVYPFIDAGINHAFMYFATPKYKIFDNYIDRYDGDWIKRLAENYLLLHYGYWMLFKQSKLFKSPSDGTTNKKVIKKGMWLTFSEIWNAIFKIIK